MMNLNCTELNNIYFHGFNRGRKRTTMTSKQNAGVAREQLSNSKDECHTICMTNEKQLR